MEASEESFAYFIGNYNLEPDGTPVFYFDKREKAGNDHAAVFSMEVAAPKMKPLASAPTT